jgi:hypothetical protein
MPDPQPGNRQLIALLLMTSAVVLGGLALLIYLDIVPVPVGEARSLVALVLMMAAAADFAIGLWFFRMGQSQ